MFPQDAKVAYRSNLGDPSPPPYLKPYHLAHQNIDANTLFDKQMKQDSMQDEEEDMCENSIVKLSTNTHFLGQNAQHGLVAAVHSDSVIKLYNLQTANQSTVLSYAGTCTSTGSELVTRDLCFISKDVLLTAHENRTMMGFDARSGQSAFIIHAKQPLQCATSNSATSTAQPEASLLVAGGDTDMYVWDIRQQKKPLLTYEDIHSEALTQVSFHPALPSVCLSASWDGLINAFDFSKLPSNYVQPSHMTEADEVVLDETLLFTLSNEQAVHRFGFFGETHANVYVVSAVETLSIFDVEEACKLVNYDRLTDQLTALLPNQRPTQVQKGLTVDYANQRAMHTQSLVQQGLDKKLYERVGRVINCHYHPRYQRLFLGCSTMDGLLGLCHVNLDEMRLFSLNAGHSRVINDYVYFNDETLVTGGEDGRLTVWSSRTQNEDEKTSGGFKPSTAARKDRRSSPY